MGMTEELTNLVVVNLETGVKEKITVYQYDTARCIVFQFINGTEIFNLTGKTARIYMNKPDGELIFNDLETVSEEEGKASILLDENMLAVTGTMYCDITIYEGDKTISVPKFCINIMKPLRNDRSITSTAEYRALTDALANVDDFKTKVDNYNTYLEKLGTASPKGAFDSLDDLKAAYPLGDDSVYLVDVDGNYYVAIYENGEWESKFPYLTDELNFLVDDLNTRFDNILNSTTTDTEVIDARYDSVNNVTYTTLKERLDATDSVFIALNDIEIPSVLLNIIPNTDITNALNTLLSQDKKVNIKFANKATYYISDTINIDLRKHQIDGNGSIFMFKAEDSSKSCININSTITETPEDYVITSISSNTGCCTAFEPLKNLIIQQKLEADETYSAYNKQGTGISFSSWYTTINGVTQKNKVATFTISNVQVVGLEKGIDISCNGFYLANFDHCNFVRNKYNVYTSGTLDDSGENISFTRCSLGSNLNTDEVCIYNGAGLNLHFQNCSIDYSYKAIYNTGKVIINNSHIETSYTSLQPENDEFCWIELTVKGYISITNSVLLLGSDSNKLYFTKYLIKGAREGVYNRSKVIISNNLCYGGVYYWTDISNIRCNNNTYSSAVSNFILPTPNINLYPDSTCTIDMGNIFTYYNSAIVTDDNKYSTTDEGYTFTHIRTGYASDHYIKFFKGEIIMPLKISFDLFVSSLQTNINSEELSILENALSVRLCDVSDNNVIIRQGLSITFSLVPGTNSISFYNRRLFNLDNLCSKENCQNLALQLRLNTRLVNLTRFTINNIKIETVEI